MKRLAQVEAEKQSLERRKAELEELDEEFYRGKVDVQSTVGEGSAFTVALPIDTEKPSLASSAPEQEEEGEGGR